MSDAVKLYREAFKLNELIDLIYRSQKVPENIESLRAANGKNAARNVDENLLKAIDVDELLRSFEDAEALPPGAQDGDGNHLGNLGDLNIQFAGMMAEKKDPAPVSPLIRLPKEIWVSVLKILLEEDPEAWFRFGITCKKHANLAFASSEVWRRMCYLIYPKQVFEENVGYAGPDEPVPSNPAHVLAQHGNSWKRMIHERPFIKTHGCYISVVNYYSEGGRAELSSSLNNPVRLVTYYRYLRFYPGGECVAALTRLEPHKVVPQLLKENKLRRLVANFELRDLSRVDPQDEPHRIHRGTWTVSTDAQVHVTLHEGSVPYYTFHYNFMIKDLGSILKHCKLRWQNFYAVWKKSPGFEDREGEVVDFSLKNEKDFKFSRVRSYTDSN